MHNNNNPKNQYRTIFAAQPQQQQPNANHPLFYYQHRNDFLSSLSDRYSAKYNLPTMDLKRNVRVGYYMDRYEDVRRRVEKEERKERCYLNGEFQTVFSGVIGERREKNRERREEEELRRDLQRFYLQEQQNHEEPEQDHPNPNIISNTNQNKPKTPTKSSPQYKTILTDYRTDPQKQKQLYLLDLQIGKLQLQQKLQKKVKQNRETCRNQQLISKLSNNILSAYMVNFDEIYNQLIDEILVEEVYYLNYMEAQYHVEKDQWNGGVDEHLERFQNAKTIKMMEVVKGLEDLCDD